LIGGGVIGLCLAIELKRRHPTASVVLIEKERDFGEHASGRNSGVLHAGFYYTADSFKAKFCREGNRRLSEYCLEKNIPLNRCGKLVVARTEQDLRGLDELLRRGRQNGVALESISAAEAREIEPRVKTVERALFSPTTASVDPKQVVAKLADDARTAGVMLCTDTCYLQRSGQRVTTSQGLCEAGYLVNAAGLYADRIARDYGFSQDYTIVPFKGLYLKSSEPLGALRTNVYPVPDLEHPFLGVHFTITAAGHIKIGPTAIPAFWREQYSGVSRFRWREFVTILGVGVGLLLNNRFGFAKLALRELQKYHKPRMVAFAQSLVAGVSNEQFRHWGPPGIRAQLVNLKERKLEMDFRYEGDDRSFHVLNAVSPAFTCSLPFSAYLVDQIEHLSNGRQGQATKESEQREPTGTSAIFLQGHRSSALDLRVSKIFRETKRRISSCSVS
jgi:L-2-hydroxyglutarate oxidase LhgO